VQELANNMCLNSKQPIVIKVGQGEPGAGATRTDIAQDVLVFDDEDWRQTERNKKEALYDHLRDVLRKPQTKCLVFVSSKVLADELADKLGREGFTTDSMHGGRKQWDRDEVLARFKNDEFRLLVATDVMGRGLDIPTITHVVIYDMGDIDDYIHRIGRTARGVVNRMGHALTLFEYNRKWPELAGALIKVLEDSKQAVPEDLRRIAEEVKNGERDIVDKDGVVHKKINKTTLNSAWCDNSHTTDDDKAERPLCEYFAKGGCGFGDSCWYRHELPPEGEEAAAP
jgi:superfamily II DNA/RNA helicase